MPTTTKFIWDDGNYLAEADGSNTINVVYTNEPQRYGNLVSSRISGTTSYHHFDAIGSTRQLTNAAGSTTDTMIYDVWGASVVRTGGTGVHLLWVGQIGYYYDSECALTWIQKRAYSPVIARWTCRDPLSLDSYVNNYPVTYADPSGLRIEVIAIEGAGAKGNEGLRLLEKYYEPIADRYPKVTWHQYFEIVWDPFGRGKIGRQVEILAKTREVGCHCCYPRIVTIGYSWGGNSVFQVLEWLANNLKEQIKIDAVLTIDPVFDNPSTSVAVAANFKNYCSWTSFYQTTDTNTLNLGKVFGRKPIVGDPIGGATNSNITDLGPDLAHLKIAADSRPINTFDSILNDFLRGSGPPRRSARGASVGLSPSCAPRLGASYCRERIGDFAPVD